MFVFCKTSTGVVTMQYKDYHSSLDPLRGGVDDAGIPVLIDLPSGLPNRIMPSDYKPQEIEDIKKLFKMDGFPAQYIAEWNLHLTGRHLADVPEDYFNFDLFTLATPVAAQPVRSVTTGYEISVSGQTRSSSSEVFSVSG